MSLIYFVLIAIIILSFILVVLYRQGEQAKKETTNKKPPHAKNTKLTNSSASLNLKQAPKPKVSKSKKHIITEDQKYWIGLIDSRVKVMPSDFIKTIGLDIESLGRDHFNEYKANESRIPKEKRKEVALDRLQGLKSIQGYIKEKGSKAQNFHLDASIKGASLYASLLGIEITS